MIFSESSLFQTETELINPACAMVKGPRWDFWNLTILFHNDSCLLSLCLSGWVSKKQTPDEAWRKDLGDAQAAPSDRFPCQWDKIGRLRDLFLSKPCKCACAFCFALNCLSKMFGNLILWHRRHSVVDDNWMVGGIPVPTLLSNFYREATQNKCLTWLLRDTVCRAWHFSNFIHW